MSETELVGLSEIAEAAGVTRQAVANWRKRFDDFPRPAQTLQSGPVWQREVIEEWLKKREGRAPEVISFINLKGGVGKTTTSVAVAEILAREHRKHVLFIDLDPQTNATISLLGEQEWKKRDDAGQTLAQLFEDRLSPHLPPKFDLEASIARGVSSIDGGISRLDLLPSSIKFIAIQEKLPFVAMQGNYDQNPQDILRRALAPVIDRYDYIIIDCPPSLGIVTKNGLRLSTAYVIPTIPDIVSTWGIFQIVATVHAFSEDLGRPIRPLGIVATKASFQGHLHSRIIADLQKGRLFAPQKTDLTQPPLFESIIKQNTNTAEGADHDAHIRTFKGKYGPNFESFQQLTREIIDRCHTPKN